MKNPVRAFSAAVTTLALAATASVWLLPSPADAQTTQQAFISKITAAAQENQALSEVPASVTMGQAILESGWGRSNLAAKYNNYFGIKCTSTKSPYQSGCVTLTTTEYYGTPATPRTEKASFRTYSSVLNSFADHSRLLTTASRYSKAFAYTTNPDQFIREVAKAGYATDPTYASTVISIMKTYNLYQYNLTPAEPKVTATAAQKSSFFSSLSSAAQSHHYLRGVPASVLLAQAAYHTNYGLSTLVKKTRNYFGLTCTSKKSPYQTGCYTVFSSVNGKIVTTKYRMYGNAAASIADAATLYATDSRYAATRSLRTAPETYLKTVAKVGYGGSAYFSAVLPYMRSNTLYRFDMPFTTLRSGQTGFRIIALQRLLLAEGFSVSFSGRFDARTLAAVKGYQRRVGLSVTGVATPQMLRLLAAKLTKTPANQRVAALQALLNGKGYSTKIWGAWDTRTVQQVTAFNKRNYGPGGGAVWLVTWAKLFA
ncbi:glucosaminidase domain-containing protein [Propionicicella superfundia]|uniref:glucosaminidase domain-containing protein n=1 Tax=Propionicicella superfundia TaxID=348582 RepID=UPI000400B0C3|nr:glucosaminidase domain-containing protein [Propionicicella superfundia]